MNKRITAWVIVALCLGLALYSGWGLKQAFDGERDLRGQIADFSAAGNDAASALASRGVASLSTALAEVRANAYHKELALVAEIAGLLAGSTLLRTRRHPS